ncbi:class I SAM-dependent methyltransferase [Hymenobacter sp. 15J16-1T3B]|uniref:class I SAM-dependent methyltransferase n=1 Tax=Hymenobacter sp. 15J16-1T3B TaxID=2886941 RepID=UPI001D103AE6|nr:class I SAM-dependent methyltransferase [Hymenobacter sp. 15J16-1T3B]MCC3156642.1 class I SAM-dependent methyltransferase [Hymenobacter sp. 15J16-1T3B]
MPRLLLLLCGLLAAGGLRAQTPSAPSAQEIEQERLRWNRALVQDTAYKFNHQPNALLVETVKGRPPGRALDIGMGQGRNALFLARQGWRVTGLDVADEAVAVAQQQAAREGLQLDARVQPMETFDFGTARYDLITYIYEGCFDENNGVLDKIKTSLKPGGVLVFEFFHRAAGLEMNRPDFGCPNGAIKALFAPDKRFRIVRYEEKAGRPDFGGGVNKQMKPQQLVYCVVQKL